MFWLKMKLQSRRNRISNKRNSIAFILYIDINALVRAQAILDLIEIAQGFQ